MYFEGNQNEWNAIFKKYEISNAKEKWSNGDAEGAGKALANKFNSSFGHKYNENKFTYHFEAKIEDI